MSSHELTTPTDGRRRPWLRRGVIAAAALVVLLALGLGGAYAYFFTGLRSAPNAFGVSSSGSGGSIDPSELVGHWTAAPGSIVGFRVDEQFVNATSPHQAVSRTSAISGGLAIQEQGSNVMANGFAFTVQMTGLQSVDKVVGFDVRNRDRIVQRSLDTTDYPIATFSARAPVKLPATLKNDQVVKLTIPGDLTVHGTTRSVELHVRGKVNGSKLDVAGNTLVDMTQFNVPVPHFPIVNESSKVTIEFQMTFAKGA